MHRRSSDRRPYNKGNKYKRKRWCESHPCKQLYPFPGWPSRPPQWGMAC